LRSDTREAIKRLGAFESEARRRGVKSVADALDRRRIASELEPALEWNRGAIRDRLLEILMNIGVPSC
jgi:hypothetical protein